MVKNIEINNSLVVRDSRTRVKCNVVAGSENRAEVIIHKQKPIFNKLHLKITKNQTKYLLLLGSLI